MGHVLIHGLEARQAALRSLDKLPPFSPILQRLMASLLNPDISVMELATLVEKDAVLTSYVLRLVNSAAYNRRGTVTSVGHAITLLGLLKLRNCLISFSVCQLWSRLRTPASWSGAKFNLHSVAVAIAADLMAQRVQVTFGEGAFIGGMLHDLGKLLIAVSFPDDYDEIRARYCDGKEPWVKYEQEVLQIEHADLSAAALARWNLPEAVRYGVAEHHRTDWGDDVSSKSGPLPMGYVIQVADQFCHASGFATVSRETDDPISEPEALVCELLPLSRVEAAKLCEAFQHEIGQIGDFFHK